MKIKSLVSIVFIVACLLLLVPIERSHVEAQPQPPVQSGPRAPGLIMKFYADAAGAWLGFRSGEFDIFDAILTRAQYDYAVTDPDILLCPVSELAIFEFDFNNNYTLDGSDVRNPLSLRDFRIALAHMVNKTYIVDGICGGFADRIDVPIPAALADWWNPNVTGPNYPWLYSLNIANAILDSLGFLDHDGDGVRNYPFDWPGGGSPPRNVDPIIFYARTDDPQRFAAGAFLRDRMIACGLSVDWRPGPLMYCYTPVVVRKEYQIYTGGSRVNRFPPTYMYPMFHSSYWCRGNYVTGMNASNMPNYPDLDWELEKAYYAPDIPTARSHCMNAQAILVGQCISVWLWSPKGYYAYRNLLGMCGMSGYGPKNIYTYMNAYRCDDPEEPIRIGLVSIPTSVNQIYSRHDVDGQLLNGFMDEVFGMNPYNILEDQPWRATDWLVGTWIDPSNGKEKTQVTWWLWPNIYWIEPVTGNVVKDYNTDDVEFSIWYYYQTPDAWVHNAYRDIHSVDRLCDSKFTIKYNVSSVWMMWNGISRHIPLAAGWLKEDLTTVEHDTWSDLTLPGPLPLPWRERGAPVQILNVTINGAIVPAQIIEGYIYAYGTANPGDVVEAWYRARGDANGYFPGGLPWQDTLVGTGPYYMTDFMAGIGGYAMFKANRKYFMSTPLLGEVDWEFRWVGTAPITPSDPSRTGYWKVTIFDVVGVASAYGSQGKHVPSPNWKPGADLALSTGQPGVPYPHPGKIDIFDIVTVTGKYNQISMEHIFVTTTYFANLPGVGGSYAARLGTSNAAILYVEYYNVLPTVDIVEVLGPHGVTYKYLRITMGLAPKTFWVWARIRWCNWNIERWSGLTHPY